MEPNDASAVQHKTKTNLNITTSKSHIEIKRNLKETKSCFPDPDKYIHDKTTNDTQ